jgi:nucleoside-diphosphate-sugar epimerase
MRVFVTGASGFVGAHVVGLLVDRGVSVAALLRSGRAAWRLAALDGRYHPIHGDLADVAAWAPALAAFRPDVVLHLAWAGVAGAHRNDPAQLGANVTGTVALVDAAADAGAGALVGRGSQAEYGPLEGPADEEHPTRPTTLYGVAKLAAGLASGVRARERGLRHAWLRLFSVYGPLDDGPWLIPSLVRALLAGGAPPLTAGTQRWDYLYVTDVADALVAAAERADVRGIYSLGSGEPRTVRSIAEAVRDHVDPTIPLAFGAVPMRPDQVVHLEADARRLRRDAAWAPRIAFADGLARTVEWARAHGARVVD